jgi:YesN/AraC family two-component response regulator
MSNTDVFDNEFDVLRMNEISSELRNFACTNKVISDVSVIYPQKDMVANQKGWWSINEYSKYLNRLYGIDKGFISNNVISSKIDYGALFSQDFCYVDSGRMIIAQQLEMTESPRAITLITIDNNFFKKYLEQLLNDELAGIEITNTNGDLLISQKSGTENTTNYTVTLPSSSLLLNINTYYQISSKLVSDKDVLFFVLSGIAALIAAAVASYILASISYSPINNLLRKIYSSKNIKVRTKESEYKFIEDSLQTLYDENINMQKSVDIYKATARKSVYIQLLKGYFQLDNLPDTLAQYDIAFTNDLNYAVIVMYANIDEDELKAKLIIAAEYAIKGLKYEAKSIDTMEDHIAIVLCFRNEIPKQDELYECAAEINDSICKLSAISVESSVSKVHDGIIGISISYQEAKNSIKSLTSGFDKTGIFMVGKTDNMYYYPTDWEQQLISNLKTGNVSVVKSIIKEIEKENKALSLSDNVISRLIDLILETIFRVSFEMNINRNEIIQNLQNFPDNSERWQLVYDSAFYICEKIINKNEQMISDINNEILEYINQNFCNPDISLKAISARINLSVASVSRIFKDVAGVNFHEYITSLRMEKAKELLKTCGYDIKNITKATGYENEYSFKRAFFRVEGVKPKEYVENIQN